MTDLKFYKYQGTGNDFVMIDDRENLFPDKNYEMVASLCDRKFGVGADGLILIRDHETYDFEMIYYNSDGKPASLCGNGSRCAVAFAHYLGAIEEKATFMTVEGPLESYIMYGLVHIKMPDVTLVEHRNEDFFIDTGSPHYIKFIDSGIEDLRVYDEGRAIRYNDEFSREGTNVNFVMPIKDHELYVRTYERGVEDETLSCGTGVTAAAIAYSLKHSLSTVKIKTLGGDLQISFRKVDENHFVDVYLIGPAKQVFSGKIEVGL